MPSLTPTRSYDWCRCISKPFSRRLPLAENYWTSVGWPERNVLHSHVSLINWLAEERGWIRHSHVRRRVSRKNIGTDELSDNSKDHQSWSKYFGLLETVPLKKHRENADLVVKVSRNGYCERWKNSGRAQKSEKQNFKIPSRFVRNDKTPFRWIRTMKNRR